MASLRVFALVLVLIAATAFAVPLPEPAPEPAPGGWWAPKHEHHIIHVPYHVHTVHHHHIKKVPVYIKSHGWSHGWGWD